ncbi:MAG: SIR2 family NAD-dependent protein deacylase [Acidobacteriota bacterium]
MDRVAGNVVVLTGAGVSAESGIPTFRGKEGYWTVGSREYHPQELATHEAFEAMPWEVWAWYLYRRGVCRAAAPNAGHEALVRAEQALGERFALVTQNVDGLHRRAGSQRMYEIHGNIDLMRCAADCCLDRTAIPEAVPALARGEAVSEAVRARLVCPRCGGMARPHVLWFDETYDEPRFYLDTARRLAAAAELLIVAGTSAQTNLPWQVVSLARRAGATIVDVNVEDNPFGELATEVVRAPAAIALPRLVDALIC